MRDSLFYMYSKVLGVKREYLVKGQSVQKYYEFSVRIATWHLTTTYCIIGLDLEQNIVYVGFKQKRGGCLCQVKFWMM